MARAQEAPKADSDTALSSSVQGSGSGGSADHSMTSSRSTARERRASACRESLPPIDPANENVEKNSTGTTATDGQEKVTSGWGWLSEYKYNSRRRPDPEDADDADYRGEDEDEVEIGTSGTLRAKSARIGEKQGELTQEDKYVAFLGGVVTCLDICS